MIRLAVRVPRAQAELALAELLSLVPAGLEETEIDGGVTEFALYGEGLDLPSEVILRAALGEDLIGVESTVVADDWNVRWRQFHRPLRLGNRLGVRPPWEPELGTEVDVVIDPGQAFGTGAHATTRLALEFLIEEPVVGEVEPVLVDLGCGSGVLAITAAKLGWRGLLALDNDPAAVVATAENAELNDVGGAIDVRLCDLYVDPVPSASLTVANLLGPLLDGWARRLAAGDCGRPDRIITSGLLGSEADTIAASFAAAGYRELDRRHMAQWAAQLFALGA